MNIPKVSKYIPVTFGLSKGSPSSNSSPRNMLLSIPRLLWLERPGPPTDFYQTYSLPDSDPKFSSNSFSDEWCDKIKDEPMTDDEQIVQQMLHNGATFPQIAKRIGKHRRTIHTYATRVRIKEAYQAWKRSEANDRT